MQKRSKSAIIRTPNFPCDSPGYFYSMLMLYVPHRSSNEFDITVARDMFLEKVRYGHIDREHLTNDNLIHEIETAVESLRMLENDILDTDNNMNSNNHDDTELDMFANNFNENCTSAHSGGTVITSDSNIVLGQNVTYLHNLQTSSMSSDDITQLNIEQKSVFDYVMKNAHLKTQIHLFCTGPGGTGKSFLIRLITKHLCQNFAMQHGTRPVLLAGPTGICSRNIQGITLHSLLKLPIDSGRRSYRSLGNQALNELRQKFSAVSHLIIDEISMVSSQMLS